MKTLGWVASMLFSIAGFLIGYKILGSMIGHQYSLLVAFAVAVLVNDVGDSFARAIRKDFCE